MLKSLILERFFFVCLVIAKPGRGRYYPVARQRISPTFQPSLDPPGLSQRPVCRFWCLLRYTSEIVE